MRRIVLCLLITALSGAAASVPAYADQDNASATHYRWKDASGVVHFSDTIPSSALAGGYDIVDKNGLVVRHVERELSPAERRAAAIAASQAAAARRDARQLVLLGERQEERRRVAPAQRQPLEQRNHAPPLV